MKKLIQRFKEWRERRYWKARHFSHIRTNVLTDLRWLSVDPVANEIMERYQWITSELFWYSTPVEPIDQFRRRIGLDPHQKKPINGLTAESAEQREQGQAVKFLADGTRFKVTLTANDCKLTGLPRDLGGRWVALVAADDDCHLKLTTPPAGVLDGWQPIETAPKDLTALLLFVPEAGGAWAAGPWRGYWSPVYDRWMAHLPVTVDAKGGVTDLHAQPTHWMPLPAAPQPAAQTQEIPAIFKEQAS